MKVMIHIGLDVHNDSIAVSVAPSDSTEVRRWGILGPGARARLGTNLIQNSLGSAFCDPSGVGAHSLAHDQIPGAFRPEVFAKEEEKMKRKKLAPLQNPAATLKYPLVPNQV